jgi:hypothetical protein
MLAGFLARFVNFAVMALALTRIDSDLGAQYFLDRFAKRFLLG